MADLTRCGPGMMRVADTALRTGGQAVMLRMPLTATSGVLGEQLGLPAATFSDEELAPVLLRESGASASAGRERWEMLAGGTAVAAVAGDSSVASALGMFAQAIGVVAGGELLQIESVSYRTIGTATYLYRIELCATESATT